MVRFDFTLDLSGLDRWLDRLGSQPVMATIRNTAQSEDGTYYFDLVNDGRGEIRPVNAKALHWVDRGGQDVFAMHAGPSAPRHIKERALPVIEQEGRAMGETWNQGGEDLRAALVEFVNQVAEDIAVPALQAVTPTVTGKLQQSYEVEKAK